MGRPVTVHTPEAEKHRIYMRAYYQRTKKTYVNLEKRRAYENACYRTDPEYRARVMARVLLAQQVRRGIQAKGPCALCDEPSTEGHHNDYTKPLEGTWLCKECHEMILNPLPSF